MHLACDGAETKLCLGIGRSAFGAGEARPLPALDAVGANSSGVRIFTAPFGVRPLSGFAIIPGSIKGRMAMRWKSALVAVGFLLGGAVSIGWLASPAAASTIYNVDLAGGTSSSAKGTITTDSTVGVMSDLNILAWDLELKSQGNTFHLEGPPPAPFSGSMVFGTAFTATATGLFFNFSAVDSSFFVLFNEGSSSYFCLQDSFGSPCPASAVTVAADHQSEAFSIGSGVQQFATVAATPIPASLPLLASALGGLGLVAWRRRTARSPRALPA